jgi:HPt (histidine-containing phosphotransfer) domain-containing protein
MSQIPQSLINPAFTSNGKPFVSSNRFGSGRFTGTAFPEQAGDPVLQSLESTPKLKRGSRSKPSVLRYPVDLGNAQVPHVMQFKAFWRWEAKDLRESLTNAKMESAKNIGNLTTLASLISGGGLDPQSLYSTPLSDEKIAALQEMMNDPNMLKVVDPATNESMATMLQNNPDKARQVLEQTITSEQSRMSSIEAELNNGAGRVGMDETERLQVQDRISTTVAETGVVDAAATGAVLGGAAGGAAGMIFGGVGAVPGAAGGAAVGAGLAAGAVGLAKAYTNEAVYDQMISIYLPFCNKVNNEDSFTYEDIDNKIAGAFFNALGSPADTGAQGLEAAGQKIAGIVGVAGSAAAARGAVVNPRLEKLFKQKDFRNFSFSWELYPRNQTEVQTIRDIIETFRYHAHPARDEQLVGEKESNVQIMLRVPAEFEVRFLSSNPNMNQAGFVENEYLPRIGRCSLTSISVDYTPNSLFSTFVDNSPTAVTMTLNFSEMGILTRETVDKGY